MWIIDTIGVKDRDGHIACIHYEVKVNKLGSVNGINGGKISRLWLSQEGKLLANFDKGWIMKPQTFEAKKAFRIIMDLN